MGSCTLHDDARWHQLHAQDTTRTELTRDLATHVDDGFDFSVHGGVGLSLSDENGDTSSSSSPPLPISLLTLDRNHAWPIDPSRHRACILCTRISLYYRTSGSCRARDAERWACIHCCSRGYRARQFLSHIPFTASHSIHSVAHPLTRQDCL